MGESEQESLLQHRVKALNSQANSSTSKTRHAPQPIYNKPKASYLHQSSSNLRIYITQAILIFIAILALVAAGVGCKILYDIYFVHNTATRVLPVHSIQKSQPLQTKLPNVEDFTPRLIPLSSLDLSSYPDPIVPITSSD